MAWRDQVGRGIATFRGVPFYVETAERSGGRETVVHKFPLRDLPYVEDLGRAPLTFQVEGYVLGPDYLTQRNALLTALEEAGPGELVHPYYGTLRVAVTGPPRVRESMADGGMARFAVEFTQTADAPAYPSAAPAAADLVDADGVAVVAALREDLTARYTVAGLATSAVTRLAGIVTTAADALDAALSPIVNETQALAKLKADLTIIAAQANAMAQAPLDAVTAFVAVCESLADALTPRSAIDGLLAAYAFEPADPRPDATTASRLVEREAYDALLGLVQTIEVVKAAQLAPGATYDSYDDAVAVRDALLAALDEQAEAASDDVYPTLLELRASLVQAVPGVDSDLPRLTTHVPAYTVPSLVLAHRLYGDIALEEDLVTRNRVVRPGFITGGVALQVLSRA